MFTTVDSCTPSQRDQRAREERERARERKTRDKTEERREKREKRREKAKREREERERRESARAREIQTPYKGNTHTGEPLRTNNKHVPVHVSLIHTLAHHPLRRSPSRAPVLPLSLLLAPSPYILHAHTSSTCKPSGANCCAFSKSSYVIVAHSAASDDDVDDVGDRDPACVCVCVCMVCVCAGAAQQPGLVGLGFRLSVRCGAEDQTGEAQRPSIRF